MTENKKRQDFSLSRLCALLCGVFFFTVAFEIIQASRNSQQTAIPTLSYLLVLCNILLATSILLITVKNLIFKNLHHLEDLLIVLGLLWGGGFLSLLYAPRVLEMCLMLSGITILTVVLKKLFSDYSFAGIAFYVMTNTMLMVGLIWGTKFLVQMPVSIMTKSIFLATTPLLLITIPSRFLQMFEFYDIVARDHWKRPRHSYPERIHTHEPFVSIHVPTYSEPPEMVKETLDKLALMQYTNYEVIIIDNNTIDSGLWLPIQLYCKNLGERFRFFHVDGITGAKAGALNWVHDKINPNTELIAVVDADYQVEPNFLQALMGYFDDPKMGFVQTPHDYRGWRGNTFLTMCYWEYKIFFHSAMISLNERHAGITVGTMCLIRRQALESAGGWSEWCVTEDSELAIRIHDAGYTSTYVDQTYGRGLIPETFEGYKKQRYRWTAGPVQEFRHHAKHFLGLSGKPSNYSFMQRIFHLNHGLNNVILGFNIPLLFIGILLVTSMTIHGEHIQVPFEMWLSATVMLFTSPILTLLMYRATIRPTIREILSMLFAVKSLAHVIYHSAFRTTLTGNAEWNRTNKFNQTPSYWPALYSVKEELTIGLFIACFVVISWLAFPYSGLSLMLLIGLSYIGFNYLCSVAMAVISVHSAKISSREPNRIKPNSATVGL